MLFKMLNITSMCLISVRNMLRCIVAKIMIVNTKINASLCLINQKFWKEYFSKESLVWFELQKGILNLLIHISTDKNYLWITARMIRFWSSDYKRIIYKSKKILRFPNLSELTPIIFKMELTHLGSEASSFYWILRVTSPY